jgi:hypothetical protein
MRTRYPKNRSAVPAAGLLVLLGLLFLLAISSSSARTRVRAGERIGNGSDRGAGLVVREHPGPRPIGVPMLVRPPRLDVLFLLDSTGSMGDEIQVVKEKMIDMIAAIEGGRPRPDVRFGVLTYRDRGDEYVTLAHDFSDDTDACIAFIESIAAAGGGDGPESVNQALHEAVHDMGWDFGDRVDRMIFLIGDAGPHFYTDDFRWQDEIASALERDIIVHTIGCSGLAGDGLRVFREIALGAEGTYEPLTYRTQMVDADGSKREVLYSGGSAYVVRKDREADVGEDAWRAGAEALLEKGVLEEWDGGGMGMVREPGEPGEVMAAPAPAAPGGRNNLDAVLTDKIIQRLERRGVIYEKGEDGKDDVGKGEDR